MELPKRKHPAHFPAIEQNNRAIIYFVTVCTKGRQRVLIGDPEHHALVAAWQEAEIYRVGRYVIMPDHIHFFCSPAEFPPPVFSQWMNYWKSVSARFWPRVLPDKLWQRDYWDTQLRRGESYSEKWEYVRANPVRAGLIDKPEDWPYQGELHRLAWHD